MKTWSCCCLAVVGVLAVGVALGAECGRAPSDTHSLGGCEHLGYVMVSTGPGGEPLCKIRLLRYPLEKPTEVDFVSICVVRNSGPFGTTEARARATLERLQNAFDLVRAGQTLAVRPDVYDLAPEGAIGIYLVGDKHPARVMSVTRADAKAFPMCNDSPQTLAYYLRNLLQVYIEFFNEWEDPTASPIVTEYEGGKILKRLYFDALEHAERMRGEKAIAEKDIREAIAMLGLDQRQRLDLLAHVIPRSVPASVQ